MGVGVAKAEAEAIAALLLAALDDEETHHCHGAIGDVHFEPGDGGLDRSELPAAAFDAIDGEHRADGVVAFEELERAFRRLDPPTRRALGEDLRPLAVDLIAAKRRTKRGFYTATIGFPATCALGFLGYTPLTATVGVLAWVGAFVAIAAYFGGNRARHRIARLVDDALGH